MKIIFLFLLPGGAWKGKRFEQHYRPSNVCLFSLNCNSPRKFIKNFFLTCRSTTMHSRRGRERDLQQSMWFPYPTNRKQELKKKLSPPNAKILQTSITRRASAICLCAHGWSISRREGIRSISSSNDASSAFFLLLLKVLTEDCLVISWSIYI